MLPVYQRDEKSNSPSRGTSEGRGFFGGMFTVKDKNAHPYSKYDKPGKQSWGTIAQRASVCLVLSSVLALAFVRSTGNDSTSLSDIYAEKMSEHPIDAGVCVYLCVFVCVCVCVFVFFYTLWLKAPF
jgi:hypothetical protein